MDCTSCIDWNMTRPMFYHDVVILPSKAEKWIVIFITWLAWLSLWRFLHCMENHAYISTMHGHLKNIPKFSHSRISQSQLRNCELIIDTGFRNYPNFTTQLLCKLFLTQLARIRIWNIIYFTETYWNIICQTNLGNVLPFTHICVYSLRRFSDIGMIMTS